MIERVTSTLRHCTCEMVAEVKSQLSYDESETLEAERSCGRSYSD